MILKKIYLSFIVITIMASACTQANKKGDEKNRTVPIVDFSGVEPLLNIKSDTTYIINFWATWCAPCVNELPYFERIAEKYSHKKVQVILINLDFPSHYGSRLIPFINEHNIVSEVIMLDDPDANSWINEVDTNWSGSIPATLIYNDTKREFLKKNSNMMNWIVLLNNTLTKPLN
ncbi:MAG: TlpA disulfide reductase family protein [Bacteroidales bacterium]|nr:TlpA disulfide reductase family protein [Bacteroidales bacterium]